MTFVSCVRFYLPVFVPVVRTLSISFALSIVIIMTPVVMWRSAVEKNGMFLKILIFLPVSFVTLPDVYSQATLIHHKMSPRGFGVFGRLVMSKLDEADTIVVVIFAHSHLK